MSYENIDMERLAELWRKQADIAYELLEELKDKELDITIQGKLRKLTFLSREPKFNGSDVVFFKGDGPYNLQVRTEDFFKSPEILQMIHNKIVKKDEWGQIEQQYVANYIRQYGVSL